MKSSQNELRSCVSNIKIYGNPSLNYLPNSPFSLPPDTARFMSNSHLSYQNVSTYSVNVGGSGNCRQSLSGSETDISTSTENLTHEEKYVLRNSTRQEPQGEETLEAEEPGVGGGIMFQGGPANRNSSYASMDQSSCGTLIIHKDIDDDDDDDDDEDVPTSVANLTSRYEAQTQARLHHSLGSYYNGGAARQHSYESDLKAAMLPKEIKGIPKQYLDQSQVLKHLALEVQKSNAVNLNLGVEQPSLSSSSSQYQQTTFFGADFDVAQLPPPPEYPGKSGGHLNSSSSSATPTTADSSPATTPAEVKVQLGESASKASTPGNMGVHSRSQPDLSQVGRWDDSGVKRSAYMSQRPKTKGKASPEVPAQVLHQRVQCAKYGFSSSDILSMDKFSESLIAENRSLKSELELYKNKVSRLQKCEFDIEQVHDAYEGLVKSSQKREHLDKAVRSKLEIEIRRQQEINKDLQVQVDTMNSHLYRKKPATSFPNLSEKVRHDLQCRDQLITQLIQQNKELTAAKERHEIELAAQRATLQEQRNHIDILDKALNNAQSNVVKLEEECKKKQTYVEQLQKALKHAQVVSERREQNERKLRNRLLKDVEELRQRIPKFVDGKSGDHGRAEGQGIDMEGRSSCGNLANGSGQGSDDLKCLEEGGIDTLKRAIREKDDRIIALESEVSKWEQHYLEENAMRQIAIDAASMPKDAKIAALERTSQESEKMIAQARSEKLKQMDELHASNKRCADLEARLKQLESQLAERDAMIKVLQKQSCDRDLAIQSAMMRLPRNPSYHVSTSSKPSSSSGRSNSLSAVVTSPPSTSSSAASSTISVQESLDDQLKKLDSELLSKNSIIQALRSEKAKYPNHYWMV